MGPPLTAPTAAPALVPAARADEEYLPLTPLRKAIAEHMVRSVQTAPHATAVVEVDMTSLVRWREANREAARARHGVDITYVAFVMQAVVDALKAVRIMNSSWGEDKIILKRRVNVGVAVGLEDGIVVPVIHDADEKSLVGLARTIDDLVQRARTNRLTLQDMQGGTFTVNNVGVFGVVASTPVINQPQAAILAMNAIVKRPVVVDDAIAIRAMMNLCLSFDHRIVDGLTAGRFLERVVQNIRGLDLSNL
jgi:pyruvate/2-oxoglutarate dehydrogenase complex dihydrolipoamide acyltransferase (E2) component